MGKLTLDPSGIQRQSMADPTLLELETAMLKKNLLLDVLSKCKMILAVWNIRDV